MEKDCYVQNTEISTRFGLSVKIQDFDNHNYEVLGWNGKGMKPSNQTNFLYKGERQCVDIYLQDGRKLTCTPEHQMLTANNEWKKTTEFKVGETRLKCSVKYPVINIKDEVRNCNNWSLKVSNNLTLKTDTIDEFIKTMAFCRLLGYILTDGCVHKVKGDNDYYVCKIFLGHMIDVNNVLNDIKLFTPTNQKKFNHKNLYEVRVPAYLTYNIVALKGMMTGARVKQPSTLPEFLTKPDCPLPLIREFLGGLFGGDGHTCVISKNTFTYISFANSKVKPLVPSLVAMMEQIKTWLARFDIKGVTIQTPKVNTASKKREDENKKNYEIVLHLDMHELIPFYEKIGFRYCCHKNQRMEAAVAYIRLREGVIRQKMQIIHRVPELMEAEKMTRQEAIDSATEELISQEPLLHSFAKPSIHDLREYLVRGRKGGRIPSSKFPTSTEFLKEIGALDWFSESKAKKYQSKKANTEVEDEEDNDEANETADMDAAVEPLEQDSEKCKKNFGVCRELIKEEDLVLPTMNLKVIDIRPGGTHPVYDIQVEKEESFLANGVVAHNCMIAHGAMGFLKERMMDVSDKFTVYICNECGLFSSVNPDDDAERKCGACENYSEFTELNIPYACKLLMQELEGMMITPRFNQEKP